MTTSNIDGEFTVLATNVDGWEGRTKLIEVSPKVTRRQTTYSPIEGGNGIHRVSEYEVIECRYIVIQSKNGWLKAYPTFASGEYRGGIGDDHPREICGGYNISLNRLKQQLTREMLPNEL